MKNNVTITAIGNVVNDPTHFTKTNEKPALTSLRLASTPGYYSAAKKEWIDGTTTWFTVNVRGAMASHTAASIKKGDPIFVSGTLSTREYEKADGGEGSTSVINATAIGHNLLMGNSVFTRTKASDDDLAASIPESVEIIDSED